MKSSAEGGRNYVRVWRGCRRGMVGYGKLRLKRPHLAAQSQSRGASLLPSSSSCYKTLDFGTAQHGAALLEQF